MKNDNPQIVYTSDVAPVVHGRWKYDLWFMTCSNCGCCLATKDDEGQWIPDNYCPNCGAKMDGGTSDGKDA